jgi:hypothetical protein
MKQVLHILIAGFMLFSMSCVVVTPGAKKDNGKHKGWYKNRNNPHHPKSTNPGHNKKHLIGTDADLSTNLSPTYHLPSRSYHMHNGGVVITRLAVHLR